MQDIYCPHLNTTLRSHDLFNQREANCVELIGYNFRTQKILQSIKNFEGFYNYLLI